MKFDFKGLVDLKFQKFMQLHPARNKVRKEATLCYMSGAAVKEEKKRQGTEKPGYLQELTEHQKRCKCKAKD